MISCLTDILNRKLTVNNERFAGAKYYGLATLVSRETQKFPAVLENQEYKQIVTDDTYPLIVYHRLLSKNYSIDEYSNDVANCQMVMVVFGKSDILKLTAEQLESQIISLFPNELLNSEFSIYNGIEGVSFSLGSSNLVAEDVFNTEYKNVDFRLGENHILFSTRYTLEVQYKKDCLELCESAELDCTLCGLMEDSTAGEIIACLSDEQEAAIADLICEAGGSCEYNILIGGVLQGTVTLTNCEDLTITVP